MKDHSLQITRSPPYECVVGDYKFEKGGIPDSWSIAIRSGVSKFHAHAARHWCATTLLKRDSLGKRLDIREVQIHLGHKSLSSTQMYTHLKERGVAEHSYEHMEKFFRREQKMMDSNINVQIKPGTEHEHGGTVEI